MKHTVENVETKEISDTMVSVRFRCCGDESTDSWCTVALALSSDETRETMLHHKTKMATAHEDKLKLRAGAHPVTIAAASTEITL
jgi:hypothetical protein